MGPNGVRRVVTGETSSGRSYIVADESIGCRNVTGIDLFQVWGVGGVPVSLPTTGGDRTEAVAGGVVRTAVGVIPPRTLVGAEDHAHLHFDEHGFHQTDSVDIAFVVSGEILMAVPDQAGVKLKAGDCVVQNGALHSWENQSDMPAVIFWTWIRGQR